MAIDGNAPSAVAGRVGTGRPPTIYDVAAVAGVSHQTVSRFLKGEGVRPRNRERVVHALAELGYQPNSAARALATSKSHRIAVLTQEMGEIGPGRILQGANKEAREAGYLLDIVPLDVGDRAAIDQAISQANSQDVAGILALVSTDEMIEAFEQADFRVPAYIGAEEDDARGEHPEQRNARGMDLIVDHLAALGHRRFLHVAGPRRWVAARNRELAFEHALKRVGLSAVQIDHGDWSAASGYDVVSRMPRDLGVTAVVAANDQMALGAILALSQAGFSVPRDVSVTGFDDIPEAAYITPPLTTVRLDFEDQGRDAIRRLVSLIDDRPMSAGSMSAELVLRASTGPARSTRRRRR